MVIGVGVGEGGGGDNASKLIAETFLITVNLLDATYCPFPINSTFPKMYLVKYSQFMDNVL
jgi:hypothetical protein